MGGRAHFRAEEREGDRESPSVNSQGRRARLLKVPRDAQSKVHVWGAGTEADKGTPQRGQGWGATSLTVTSTALWPPEGARDCGLLPIPGGLGPGSQWPVGLGLRQGRKMQREAGLGPGGYSKPQQELEPFQAQDQSLDFPTQERG